MPTCRAVEAAGALTVLIPPGSTTRWRCWRCSTAWSWPAAPTSTRRGTAPRCDEHTAGLRPDRDDSELALAQVAADSNLPTLGICRGMQVMVVAAGGRLHQHVPDLVGHEEHRPAPGTYGEHGVSLSPGQPRPRHPRRPRRRAARRTTRASTTRGASRSRGTPTTAPSRPSRTPRSAFSLGVLWHPEVRDDVRLFEALVEAAARPA